MYIVSRLSVPIYSQGFQERYGNMTNSEEWYGKMADNENSILKETYGNMTLSSSGCHWDNQAKGSKACSGLSPN